MCISKIYRKFHFIVCEENLSKNDFLLKSFIIMLLKYHGMCSSIQVVQKHLSFYPRYNCSSNVTMKFVAQIGLYGNNDLN